MTKLSRWVGLLEVISDCYVDDSPIFYPEDDPFIIRFRVRPIVWLSKQKAIPIHEDSVWKALSFTRDYDMRTSSWTGKLRNSLNRLNENDGLFLERLLCSQADNGKVYEVDEEEYRRLVTQRIRRFDKSVSVSVPRDDEPGESAVEEAGIRESCRIQAHLARIGEGMGFSIWIPKSDRTRILQEWLPGEGVLLDRLPLNYDETTLGTIEQIDLLWLRKRAIVRAFEIEHSTAVYSGILRMADLLALQPNMDIRLHIVAPYERREKVFREIQRPVFSLLDRAPLAEICTFLSYDAVRALAEEKHLAHLSDSVLEEYAEEAE